MGQTQRRHWQKLKEATHINSGLLALGNGSEWAKRSGVTGKELKEATHINSGLLDLGNVIVPPPSCPHL
eukprot:gene3906-13976_t